jgi:uncharacterized protein
MTIRDILTQSKTIAVVGLSSNPERSSFGVAQALQRSGYRIIPVNPNETEVLGEKSYAKLEDIPHPVDLVNVFRRPLQTPAIAQSAVNIGAKALWLQLDITNEEAKQIATKAGLGYVEDHCVMVELRKLG